MEIGGIFFKNLELYPPPTLPPIRFGRVVQLLLKKGSEEFFRHLQLLQFPVLNTVGTLKNTDFFVSFFLFNITNQQGLQREKMTMEEKKIRKSLLRKKGTEKTPDWNPTDFLYWLVPQATNLWFRHVGHAWVLARGQRWI